MRVGTCLGRGTAWLVAVLLLVVPAASSSAAVPAPGGPPPMHGAMSVPAVSVVGQMRAGCSLFGPRAFAIRALGPGRLAPIAPGVTCLASTGFGITVTWRFERLVGATWKGFAWPYAHLALYGQPMFGAEDLGVRCKRGQHVRLVTIYRISNTQVSYLTAPVTCP